MASMSLPSSRRLAQSTSIGNRFEKEIAPVFFSDLGWSFNAATDRQNWEEKFDYIVCKHGKELRVEVKAPKQHNLSQEDPLILLEYTGITGRPGWLRGNADVILQFVSERSAIAYRRINALRAYDAPLGDLSRLFPGNTLVGQWFGRAGLSRKGTPNQDVIRWERLEHFCNVVGDATIYILKSSSWQKQ